MKIESSDNSKEKSFSQSLKIEKENIICKNGFCSLPNQTEDSILDKMDINVFDPI